MPQVDQIHQAIRNALEKQGWTILRDPFSFEVDGLRVFVDLTAEIPIGTILEAELGGQRVAVEVKSFSSGSFVNEFQKSLGQYLMYRTMFKVEGYDYPLFLGIPSDVYESYFILPIIQTLMLEYQIKLLVVNDKAEEVEAWIN